jgi:hypothetical protein
MRIRNDVNVNVHLNNEATPISVEFHEAGDYHLLKLGNDADIFVNELAILVRLRDALDAAIQARQAPEVAA